MFLLTHEVTTDGLRRAVSALRAAGIQASIVNAGAPPGAAAS